MKICSCLTVGFALVLGSCLNTPAAPQQSSSSRKITSLGFGRPPSASEPETTPTSKQPPPTPTGRRKPGPAARRKDTYQLARVERKPSKPRPKPPATPGRKNALTVEEVGVTFWRLRQSRPTDTGPQITVDEEDSPRMLMTPERVTATTQFRTGDRVRLDIEAKRSGYLYVINREIYANGRLRKPVLLFPAPVNTDGQGRMIAEQANQVEAGRLVDIPDWADDVPYFKVDPKSPDYAGELLLLILSPTPLRGLEIIKRESDDEVEQSIVSEDLLAQWEEMWGANVEMYVKEGGNGEALTTAEQQAACGAKSRQLTRLKPRTDSSGQTPCGDKPRLTQEEPLPQSIHLVSVPQDQPIIIPVRLAVQRLKPKSKVQSR